MPVSDDELAKKLLKIICDVKKSRLVFKSIANEANGHRDDSPEEEYTVIGKKELDYLRNIESRFFKICEAANKMYKSMDR